MTYQARIPTKTLSGAAAVTAALVLLSSGSIAFAQFGDIGVAPVPEPDPPTLYECLHPDWLRELPMHHSAACNFDGLATPGPGGSISTSVNQTCRRTRLAKAAELCERHYATIKGQITAAHCLDDVWLSTGMAAVDAEHQDYDEVHKPKEEAYWRKYALRLGYRLPKDWALPNRSACTGVSAADVEGEVRPAEPVDPEDADRTLFTGEERDRQAHFSMSSTYMGKMAERWTYAAAAADGTPVMSPGSMSYRPGYEYFYHRYLQSIRANYDSNGAEVASCEEYVFEKYYDYSIFEEATAPLGSDWRAVFEKAYEGSAALSLPALSVASTRDGALSRSVMRERPRRSSRSNADGSLSARVHPRTYKATPPYAIGTLGLRGLPLRSRDRRPMSLQIEFPREAQPKNPFFATPFSSGGTCVNCPDLDGNQAWVTSSILGIQDELDGFCSANPDHPNCNLTECGESVSLATLPMAPRICDPAIASRLEQGRDHGFVESWAWHKRKSEVLAPLFSDEELEARAEETESYEQLLAERVSVMRAIFERYARNFERTVGPLEEIRRPGPPIGAVDPVTLMTERQRLRGTELAQEAQFGSVASPVMRLFRAAAGSGSGSAEARFEDVRRFRRSSRPELSPATGGSCDLGCLRRRLASVDRRINLQLEAAMAKGCLDLDAANACDWSPRRFARRVANLFAAEREADYSYCTENTTRRPLATLAGRNFTYRVTERNAQGELESVYRLPTAPLVGHPEAAPRVCYVELNNRYPEDMPTDDRSLDGSCTTSDGCVTNHWTQNTAMVDQYFLCLRAYKTALKTEVVGALEDSGLDPFIDESGNPQIAGSDTNYHDIGDKSSFAVTAEWGSGWRVGDLGTLNLQGADQCGLEPEAFGFFIAEGYVFGNRYDLVEASAHGKLAPLNAQDRQASREKYRLNTIYFSLLDYQILKKEFGPSTRDSDDFHFNIAKGTLDKSVEFAAEATAAIGPFAVTVGGGVSGTIGMEYGIGVVAEGTSACDQTVGLHGGIRPFARADAYAFIEAGIPIALGVGVEGKLKIVDAEAPFKAGVVLDYNYQGSLSSGPTIDLEFSSRLDYRVDLLSGKIIGYVRVVGARFDKELFTWDGLLYSGNAFNASAEFSLSDLMSAL